MRLLIPDPKPQLSARFDGTAAVLGLLATGLYVLTWQAGFWGDSIEFTNALEGHALAMNHILYLPVAALLKRAVSAVFGLDSLQTLRLLSSLCGGLAVAATYSVGKRVLDDRRGALLGALLTAGLPAFWFHATVSEIHLFHTAGSWLLLASFVRCVQAEGPSRKDLAIHAAGHALSPATHLSGLSSFGVSALFGVFQRRSRPLLLSAALGLAAFLAAYGVVRALNPDRFRYYEGIFRSGYYPALWNDPALIPSYLNIAGSELLSLSVPASAFLPAGLWLLARRSRSLAWLFALWILGYVGMCAPIGDIGEGGYYAPTFAVQSWLAVIAMRELARRPVLCAAAVLAAASPFACVSEDDGVRFLVSAAACAAVTAIALPVLRRERGSAGAGPLPLVLLALPIACGAWTYASRVRPLESDPLQSRVDYVASVTTPDSRLLVAEPDLYKLSRAWRPLLRLRGREDVVLLAQLDAQSQEGQSEAVAALREDVTRRVEGGRPVWVVFQGEFPEEAPFARQLLAWIERSFSLERPPDGRPGVVRVMPRKVAPR